MPIQLPRANLSANLQGAVAIDENTLTSVLIENLNGNLTARLNHEISALTSDSHARFHAIETMLTNLNAKLDHLLNASAEPSPLPYFPRSGAPHYTSISLHF